jgi:hypothetical protein
MSDPVTPPSFAPEWLAPEDVKTWLRLRDYDTTDDDVLAMVCAMAEPYVERCRPEFAIPATETDPASYAPDAEAYNGAVMYAAREFRRRNSPAGVEVFGEVTSFVTRYDTDIERALHTGAWAPPITA